MSAELSFSNSYDFNVSCLKPESIDTFKQICSEKKELLIYLSKFGDDFNKATASLILTVGGVQA